MSETSEESTSDNNHKEALEERQEIALQFHFYLTFFAIIYVGSYFLPSIIFMLYLYLIFIPFFLDNNSIISVFTNMKVFEAWKDMTAGRASPTYYFPPAHEILSIIGQATLDAMYGKGTPKAILDQAAKEIDAILAKY